MSKLKNDFNRDELESLIVEDLSLKTWLYNKYGQEKIAIKEGEIQKELEELKANISNYEKNKKKRELENWYENYYKKVIIRENSKKVFKHVENCPLRKRVYNGSYFANVDVDCLNCEHSRGTRENGDYLICLHEYNIKKAKLNIRDSE